MSDKVSPIMRHYCKKFVWYQSPWWHRVGNSLSLYLICKPLDLGFYWGFVGSFFNTERKGVKDLPFANSCKFSKAQAWPVQTIIRDLLGCKIQRKMNVWIWCKASGLMCLHNLILKTVMSKRKRMKTHSISFVLPSNLCTRYLDWGHEIPAFKLETAWCKCQW